VRAGKGVLGERESARRRADKERRCREESEGVKRGVCVSGSVSMSSNVRPATLSGLRRDVYGGLGAGRRMLCGRVQRSGSQQPAVHADDGGLRRAAAAEAMQHRVGKLWGRGPFAREMSCTLRPSCDGFRTG
jgi:hypothetical protein